MWFWEGAVVTTSSTTPYLALVEFQSCWLFIQLAGLFLLWSPLSRRAARLLPVLLPFFAESPFLTGGTLTTQAKTTLPPTLSCSLHYPAWLCFPHCLPSSKRLGNLIMMHITCYLSPCWNVCLKRRGQRLLFPLYPRCLKLCVAYNVQ